jgi:hypothetical protein
MKSPGRQVAVTEDDGQRKLLCLEYVCQRNVTRQLAVVVDTGVRA